ncbi:hypothetical protein AQUCO_02100041v1 [Aquilegia coerulea]|uniref:Uncharacterized protein n=1 Tax=Aquilegia coerulea TaxID=218851 RepID=A0A2G5DFD9_AQUCA|nr:hypothetical protein AQUCO_02100041v1 [Aquilegia coerulea]
MRKMVHGQLKQGLGIGESGNTVAKGVTNISSDANIFCSVSVGKEHIPKYPLQVDTKLKSQIDQAEAEVFRINESFLCTERTAVLYQLKPLIIKDKRLDQMLKWEKYDSINHQHSQGKLFRARTVSRQRVVDLCSSEEELTVLVSLLHNEDFEVEEERSKLKLHRERTIYP